MGKDESFTGRCNIENTGATAKDDSGANWPNISTVSSRNATQIVETTENFMQILDSCTKNEQNTVSFYHERRGGIRVEDLINRFKSESKFDTMKNGKRKA